MRAGDYSTQFEWFQHSFGDKDSFGQPAEDYTTQGNLWGALEDLSAGEQDLEERQVPILRATIRLRNYPEVAYLDTLYDTGTETEWTVRSSYAGDNEIICEVEA